MSYGWLTESALLPTRAVPIRGVSDTSLLPLSNQIFSLQQEQQDQQQHSLRPQAAGATAAGATSGGVAAAGVKRNKRSFRSRSSSEEEYHFDSASASRHGDQGGGEDGKRAESGAFADGPGKEDEATGEDVSERLQSGRRSELLRATAARKRNTTSELSSAGEEQHDDLYVLHASSRKAWTKPSRRSKTREELLFEGKNVRVDERAAKDESHYKAMRKNLAASRRRLEKKAKLYEELVSGRLDCSSAPAGARLVVDFEEKLWRRSSSSAPSIRDTPATDGKEAAAPSVGESNGEADFFSRYFAVEEHDRYQKERQDARKLRLDCLRLRLISFREATCVAAGGRTAAARIPGDYD